MATKTIQSGGKNRLPSTGAARLVAALAISTAMSAAMLTQAIAQQAYIPGPPEPGTEIPKSTVRLGLLPYADGSFPIIGVKKGFFSDVGITMSPPDGTTLTEESAHSLLVRGDVDITHGYPPNFLPTYQTSQAVRGDLVAGLLHRRDRFRILLERFGDAEDRDRKIALCEHAIESPPAGARAVFVLGFDADVADVVERRRRLFREPGLAVVVTMQDGVFATLLVVDDELNGELGPARPVGVWGKLAVPLEIAWIHLPFLPQ